LTIAAGDEIADIMRLSDRSGSPLTRLAEMCRPEVGLEGVGLGV